MTETRTFAPGREVEHDRFALRRQLGRDPACDAFVTVRDQRVLARHEAGNREAAVGLGGHHARRIRADGDRCATDRFLVGIDDLALELEVAFRIVIDEHALRTCLALTLTIRARPARPICRLTFSCYNRLFGLCV